MFFHLNYIYSSGPSVNLRYFCKNRKTKNKAFLQFGKALDLLKTKIHILFLSL